jgi:O-antigen ligase
MLRKTSSFSQTSRLHDAICVFLLVVIALAPIPFGSNRPFFWAFWAAVINAAFAIYLFKLDIQAKTFRLMPRHVRSVIICWVAFVVCVFISALPAGYLTGPFEFHAASGEVFKSAYPSLAPGGTLLATLRAETYGLFALLVFYVVRNGKRRVRMLRAVLVIVCAHAAYGLLALTQFGDTILVFSKWSYFGSATGTFVNRNSFATFLALGAVVAPALLFSKADSFSEWRNMGKRSAGQSKALQGIATLLIAATLFATQSRMGVFATASGVLVVLSIIFFKQGSARTAFVPVLFVLCGGAILLVAFGDGLLERFGTLNDATSSRLELYREIVEMILARPLLGYGGDAFELAFPLYHQPDLSTELVWGKAHSTYLTLWVEHGVLVGSLPLIALCLVATQALRRVISEGEDWRASAVALGALTVGAVHSLVDFSLEIQANSFLFILLVVSGAGPMHRPLDELSEKNN